jgi:para-nitrobenzyl esterase
MSDAAPCAEVTLPHGGRLRGAWQQGVRVFRGVRYAQAPIGAARFAAPRPAQPWAGLRDATTVAPMAPQLARSARVGDAPLGNSDCLLANIWAPPEEPGVLRPVMVWIHGGGFFRGSASDPMYDGASFARQGIVFVALQYRLGIDGFLHFDSGDDGPGADGVTPPANRGLLDQLAALQWVQDHIHAWGGDAKQITVFGQSAGAGALVCLLGMPASQGLFQRVILQSPSVSCQTLEEAASVRHAIAHLLGTGACFEELSRAPQELVLHAVHRLANAPALRKELGLSARQFFPLRPVIDGAVLRAAPLQALEEHWRQQPPNLQVLVGSNAQEMRLYHVPGAGIERVTEAQVRDFAQDAGLTEAALASLRSLLPLNASSPGETLANLQSDYYYRVPAQRIAELAARHATSSHRYEFEWHSPQWAGRLGAAHGVELPFVFNALHSPQGQELTGAGAPAALAQEMHGSWASFARSGDPGWQRFAQTDRWTMHFATESRCDQHLDSAGFQVWRGIV